MPQTSQDILIDNKEIDIIEKPDISIIDPPRSGLHPKALKNIIKLKQKKIIYVSCNPSTQARDLKDFIKLKIDEGWSDDKIKSFLISKYGKEILATPQKKGSDLFLWIIPILVLLFGVFIYWSLYRTIRFRKKGEQS